MHPCFQNGDYPADAENPYQTSVISHTLKIQSITPSNKKSVIASEPQVRVAISSLQQQNSGHGARAPGNDCPPRGPPPMSFLRSLSPRRRGAGTQFYSANQPYFVAKE